MNSLLFLVLAGLVGALCGCCDRCYEPMWSYRNDQGHPIDAQGPISETRSVKTPLATIIATRNGTIWNVSVLSTKADDYGNTRDTATLVGNRQGFGTYRFSAADDMKQVVTPVPDGSVTLAYARVGWSASELRIIVTDIKATVIHSETLR